MEQELTLVTDQQGRSAPVVQHKTTGSTPADLVRYAMESGADLDRLERLMQMQIDWEKREAEKAFHDAMATFKENAPTIHKNKMADFATSKGRTTYGFSDLGNVVAAVVPALAAHGFSHRWVPDQNGSRLGITCILTHKQGHSESLRLEASNDDSGGKNSIQAIGSAKSYLERYTLLAACGLAVEDGSDDDGASAVQQEPVKQHPKEKIVGPRFDQALEAIRNGKYSAADMRDYYGLTPDQDAALRDVEKELVK